MVQLIQLNLKYLTLLKELSILDVRKVRGAKNSTIYTVGSNENGSFLAVADNANSGLGKS